MSCVGIDACGSYWQYWVLASAGIVPQLLQLYEDAYRDSGSKANPNAQAAQVFVQPEIKLEPRAEPAS